MIPYIVLHKSEWDRLKKQITKKTQDNGQREFNKELIELSQKWVRSWPDSQEGHLAELKKRKRQQEKQRHEANIQFIKSYNNKVRASKPTDAIKQAREEIFWESGYGRQLKSALLESKTLEERDAQIEFKKHVDKETAKQAKEDEKTLDAGIYSFPRHDEEKEKEEKLKNLLHCVLINKSIVEENKEKELQEKKLEEKLARETELLVKEMMEKENQLREEKKRCYKQSLKDYEIDSKLNAMLKEHDRKLDDALTELYKKKADKIWLKSKATMKEIHQNEKFEWSKNLYEKVQRIQIEENSRYENFINKGIKAYEKRMSEKENKIQDEIKKNGNSNLKLLSAENNQSLSKVHTNKMLCERQTLAFKSKTNKKTVRNNKEDNNINGNQTFSFLAHPNPRTKALREREKQPSPFNETKSAHAHFLEHAENVLKEIKYKHCAEKFIQEYHKLFK